MRNTTQLQWGVTIAAAQTEGAHDQGGKGASIWDTFTTNPRVIKDRSNAQVATDFYHRYQEDIDLAVTIGLKIFRFSVAWSRILPTGTGAVNPEGIAFYNRVIDYCLSVGITPWITTYHWDLPQALQDIGGWRNRAVVTHYQTYITILRTHFADRVKNWILVNEAIVCIGAGYFLGIHAPGKRGITNFSASIHHLLLAQAKGFKILKAVEGLTVGTAISCTKIDAYRDNSRDQKAVKRMDALMNRLCIEPYLGMGYPSEIPTITRHIQKFVKEGDLEEMQIDFDFWGIQTYAREVVKSAWYVPYLGVMTVPPRKRNVAVSVMGWETYPQGTRYFAERFAAYDPDKPLWLSECGMALAEDEDDQLRVNYYQQVLAEAEKILEKGIKLQGILLWTLVDNFEWAEGYIPKFGIISLNQKTLERKMKKTAYWLKNYLAATNN